FGLSDGLLELDGADVVVSDAVLLSSGHITALPHSHAVHFIFHTLLRLLQRTQRGRIYPRACACSGRFPHFVISSWQSPRRQTPQFRHCLRGLGSVSSCPLLPAPRCRRS